MPDRSGPALVIADGSLPGLVAIWAENVARVDSAGDLGASVSKSAIWMPGDDLPARARREAAVRRQARIAGMLTVVKSNPVAYAPVGDRATQGRMDESALLLSAAAHAMAIGLRRVVWPVHWASMGEPDLDWLSDTTDRAMLVGQLASIDVPRVVEGAGGGAVRIETPYADFDDAELLELALDMDVPLGAAWWCQREGAGESVPACGACPACQRMRAALDAVDPQGLLKGEGLFMGQGQGQEA